MNSDPTLSGNHSFLSAECLLTVGKTVFRLRLISHRFVGSREYFLVLGSPLPIPHTSEMLSFSYLTADSLGTSILVQDSFFQLLQSYPNIKHKGRP